MQDLLKIVKMHFGGWGSNPMAKQIDITVLVKKCNNWCFFLKDYITDNTTLGPNLYKFQSIDEIQ